MNYDRTRLDAAALRALAVCTAHMLGFLKPAEVFAENLLSSAIASTS